MSRNTSPAPQTLSIPPLPSAHSSRQKSKNIPMGITAGAEDVKYQAKYKELKRKVKEIEQDNDRLHFKVLQAKRNIQRMKIERAILYDRLASFPPSPELNDHQSLPPMNPVSQLPSSAVSHSGHPDPNYIRTRVPAGPDGRPVSSMDPPIGPGVVPSLSLHNSRQSSSGSDTRQLPPLALPPMQALDRPPSPLSRSHHDGPSIHHERTSSHSHSSSRSRVHPPQAYHHASPHQQQYENYPPIPHHASHSPSLSERRRHDIHDMEPSRAPPPLSPTQESSRSISNRDRVHNHQRLGPGTYINREDQAVRDREQRDYERVREWEPEHETAYRDGNNRSHQQQRHHHSDSPPAVHRSSRQQPPPQSHHSRMRDEQGYYLDIPAGAGKVVRSDTPGSGGSGHGPSPDSPRGAGSQYPPYELDRQRPYKLQPVGEPMDYGHPEDRSPTQSRTDRNGGGGSASMYTPSDSGSRKEKRPRNEAGGTMDVDNGAYLAEESPTGSGLNSYTHHQDRDRSLKRYQPRGSESLEDVRMGP
ncbi:hypothetical protein E1B28_004661 [Marasmius oreades]|uniref:INO80 complex subunit F domain-containing protein n=1 Tax=Marasmius oreades TaxID=181124 RepID=A0A9P7UZ38_9AGAR|nr:uncharacterized protein E1B28_004661 [Marasmius oreades]KAG7097298.1 hypothetical protein E1B28_004661 [Marasmius oreades]